MGRAVKPPVAQADVVAQRLLACSTDDALIVEPVIADLGQGRGNDGFGTRCTLGRGTSLFTVMAPLAIALLALVEERFAIE